MLRKNVSGQYLYFALVNASTGAALTGATVTARRTIDGGAQATCTGTVSEPGNGQYQLALSQADTNGNDIGYLFTATSAIPVHIMATLTAADPTDAADFGLTNLDAAITSRMATYTQPTGFLAATFPTGTIANTTNITAGTITTVLGNVDGNLGGNVTGSVGSVVGLTAANLDVAVSTRMATYTQPTGFLAATFDSGTVASTTNITAGTITTVSGNVNGNVAGSVDSVTGSVGSVVGLTAANLDVAVSTRMATYTQPTGFLAATFPGTVASTTNITAATGVVLSTAGNEAAADALLDRTISGGANGGRDVTSALRFIRNRWVVSTGTLTVYQEDDTTSAWTAVVTGTPGADPITGTDPT